MAAAWSDYTEPEKTAGATVSMNVSYAAAAVASDLTAHATVVRRGRSLCFCEVTVTDADGKVVAHGSMVHRYGWTQRFGLTNESSSARRMQNISNEHRAAGLLLPAPTPLVHHLALGVEPRRLRVEQDTVEVEDDGVDQAGDQGIEPRPAVLETAILAVGPVPRAVRS